MDIATLLADLLILLRCSKKINCMRFLMNDLMWLEGLANWSKLKDGGMADKGDTPRWFLALNFWMVIKMQFLM